MELTFHKKLIFFFCRFFCCKETQLIQNFAITCTIKFLAGKAMFDNTQNKPNFIHFNDLIRISLQYFFGQLIKNSESFTFPLMINYRKSRREEVEYQFVQKNFEKQFPHLPSNLEATF